VAFSFGRADEVKGEVIVCVHDRSFHHRALALTPTGPAQTFSLARGRRVLSWRRDKRDSAAGCRPSRIVGSRRSRRPSRPSQLVFSNADATGPRLRYRPHACCARTVLADPASQLDLGPLCSLGYEAHCSAPSFCPASVTLALATQAKCEATILKKRGNLAGEGCRCVWCVSSQEHFSGRCLILRSLNLIHISFVRCG